MISKFPIGPAPIYLSSFLSLCSGHPDLPSVLRMPLAFSCCMAFAQAVFSAWMFSTFQPLLTRSTSTRLLELSSDKVRSCHWHTPITLNFFLPQFMIMYLFVQLLSWWLSADQCSWHKTVKHMNAGPMLASFSTLSSVPSPVSDK